MSKNRKYNSWITAVMILLCCCIALSTSIAAPSFSVDTDDGKVKVTIHPSPDFNLKDTALCLGAEINLQDLVTDVSANATVTFYSDALAQNPLSDIQTPSNTTKYYARAVRDTSLCSSATDSLIVVVGTIPTISIPQDSVAVVAGTVAFVTIPVTHSHNGRLKVFYSLTGDSNALHDSFTIDNGADSPFNWELAVPRDTGVYHVRIDSTVSEAGCKAFCDSIYTLYVYGCQSPDFNIICPNDTVLELPYGLCEINLPSIGTAGIIGIPSADLDTIYNNAPEGLIFGQGVHKITWTAVDGCGRLKSCKQIVIVNYPSCGTDIVYYFDRDHNIKDSLRTVVAVDWEGNTYHSVRIGCNCWTVENLISTRYKDGREIDGHYIYYSANYPDTIENLSVFGRLYSWSAAMDLNPRVFSTREEGICPEGWALPTVDDYIGLLSYGTESLTTEEYWLYGGGNNVTGFTALPAGLYKSEVSRFYYLLGDTYFWTSTNTNDYMAKACHFRYLCPEPFIINMAKSYGASIRCIKIY